MRRECPATYEEAAELMGACGRDRTTLRPCGHGTKAWGRAGDDPDLEIGTDKLDSLIEHNAGDFTAVLQPGIPLAAAQAVFAESDQMLALDPPLAGDRATVGGVVASGDSGPLRHNFKSARDLVLGVKVALSDGIVATAGSRVIKNVAGYDLAKLYTGSFGTLGLIVEMTVRLHPRPPGSATAVGHASDPEALAAAASAVAHARLESNSLDVFWGDGAGRLLARYGGAEPGLQAEAALRVMEDSGVEAELIEADAELWERQRNGQRSTEGVVVKVSALPAALPAVLRAADEAGGAVVGRAGMGLSWITLSGPAGEGGTDWAVGAIDGLRHRLDPYVCTVLDAPAELRAEIDVWGEPEGPALDLMRRVKERFDPHNVCNPGVFVGGI